MGIDDIRQSLHVTTTKYKSGQDLGFDRTDRLRVIW